MLKVEGWIVFPSFWTLVFSAVTGMVCCTEFILDTREARSFVHFFQHTRETMKIKKNKSRLLKRWHIPGDHCTIVTTGD